MNANYIVWAAMGVTAIVLITIFGCIARDIAKEGNQ